MTVIYLTESNTRCYGVTFQNNGCIKLQKFKDKSIHEILYSVQKPLEFFSSEGEECDMTLMSGAFDKSVIDGNKILLEICEENDKQRYL